MTLSLRSEAWDAGARIPRKYTADGEDRSPPLSFEGAPPGVVSYALICDDPDAPVGTWVHWVIYNIPGSARGLPEAVPALERLPDGTCQGRNSWDRVGYGGPSPPAGSPHRYFFRLYALTERTELRPGLRATEVEATVGPRAIAKAEFLGRYGRPAK